MKIALLSDLHVETHPESPRLEVWEDVDAILLAGDVSEGVACRRWAEEWQRQTGVPVCFVLGNHEYYGNELEDLERQCRQGLPPGVHLLQCNEVRLGDYLLLGATLWTDFALYGDVSAAQEAAAYYMPDYQMISLGGRLLTPDDTAQIHAVHRDWLRSRLQQARDSGLRTIVMTHHAPTPRSIAPRFAGSDASPAFASDLREWMRQAWAPVLWVHGHTHHPVDYVHGRTRVVSHPRGYPFENGLEQEYEWGRVIELL